MTPLESVARDAAAALGGRLGIPGLGLARVEELRGQASARRYVRLHLDRALADGRRSAMLVLLGDNPCGSEEASREGGGPRELPFCNVQRFLADRGVPVPGILVDEWSRGWLVQTDLGDRTLHRALAGLRGDALREAMRPGIDFLVEVQAAAWADPQEECVAFTRRFDPGLLRWELDHFFEWGLVAHAGADPSDADREALARVFDSIAADLAGRPPRFVHRDFQSTNLMVTPGGLALIDFQDALLGPEVYDLVAYLRDSYVELTPDDVERLIGHYLDARSRRSMPPPPDDFPDLFHLQTVQRKLKDAGRFVFIDRVKGNPGYLPFIAPSLRYVADALRRLPRWGGLVEILARWIPEFRSRG